MAKKKTQYTTRARGGSKAEYGAPAEERELVVTVDKRFLFGVALIAVFGVAVGISALNSARGRAAGDPIAPAPGNAPVLAANPVAEQLGSMTKAESRSAARAAGLPDNVTIVDQDQYNIPTYSTVVPSALEHDPNSVEAALEEMKAEGVGEQLDVDAIADNAIREIAGNWTHDVLAGIPDPNVTADEFKVFRPEDISSPLKGPRLGIAGLNTVFTYDFGMVKMDEMARSDLMMKNVGDAPLTISRVYSGCGCTAPRIGDVIIDEAGWLPTPLTLAPGEEVDFTVEFDPQLAKETKAQAKWIQIFSNDDSKEVFDPSDANSHESRFRIVVQPTYGEIE